MGGRSGRSGKRIRDVQCSSCPTLMVRDSRRKGTQCGPCHQASKVRASVFCACGQEMRRGYRNQGDKCRTCCEAERRLADRFCEAEGCGVKLARRSNSATNLCRVHAQAWDARRERLRIAAARQRADPEAERRRGRAITNAKLAHIPLEYRDAYKHLGRTTQCTAEERTAAIRNQMEADARKHHTSGTLPQTKRSTT